MFCRFETEIHTSSSPRVPVNSEMNLKAAAQQRTVAALFVATGPVVMATTREHHPNTGKLCCRGAVPFYFRFELFIKCGRYLFLSVYLFQSTYFTVNRKRIFSCSNQIFWDVCQVDCSRSFSGLLKGKR